MKRVLILHTGGTLGMAASPVPDATRPSRPSPLRPDAYAEALLGRVPELSLLAAVETRILCNLDSSDIGPEEWTALAEEVEAARRDYDGVVIVHGTDTMAFTAAALSYALEGLDRPVVMTGSQRPLAEVRSDARRNLVDAVDLATRDVPEVGICFDGVFLRGNRATKGDAWSYAAFASPGCAPLCRFGIDVEVAPHVRRPQGAFRLDARFDQRVAVCHVVPGLDPDQLTRLAEGMGGVVLQAFGVGNVPTRVRPLADRVERLVAAGVTVLVVTQARAGGVELSRYEGGAGLERVGAVSGGDMGLEAAVTKLMHALAVWPRDAEARREYLLRDVAGKRR